MRLKERNRKIKRKVACKCLNHYLFFNCRRVAVLHKDSIGDFCSDTLDLPKNRLVSTNNFFSVCCWCGKILWTRHVHYSFKELNPRFKIVSIHKIRAHLKLITYVKDLTNKMKHVKSVIIFFIVDHIVDERS